MVLHIYSLRTSSLPVALSFKYFYSLTDFFIRKFFIKIWFTTAVSVNRYFRDVAIFIGVMK